MDVDIPKHSWKYDQQSTRLSQEGSYKKSIAKKSLPSPRQASRLVVMPAFTLALLNCCKRRDSRRPQRQCTDDRDPGIGRRIVERSKRANGVQGMVSNC